MVPAGRDPAKREAIRLRVSGSGVSQPLKVLTEDC